MNYNKQSSDRSASKQTSISVHISKWLICSTITTLTSQIMYPCTSDKWVCRHSDSDWEDDWKRMKWWQDQCCHRVSAVHRWVSQAIYFTVVIPTITTALRNNDFLCWRGMKEVLTEENNFGSHGNQENDDWSPPSTRSLFDSSPCGVPWSCLWIKLLQLQLHMCQNLSIAT